MALDRTAAPDAAPPASRRGWWAAGAVALVAAGTAAILALGPRDPVVFAPTPPPASPVGPGEPVARAPELAPPPRAVDRMALATPGQLRARRHESAGRLVEWVRANNRWKPDADIAVKTAAMVEEAIPRADAFTAAFGGALTRSGKPTLVTCRTGGFFVFELTPAQARGADLNAGRNWFVSCSYPADPRRAVPRVVVSDLRLDGGGELAPGSRLDGSVACEFPEAPEPGSYLRITHHMPDGRRVMFLHHPRETPPAGRVVMRFSANPLEPRPGRGDQLVPVFADWVSPGDVVESDAAAALALVRDDR